WPWLLGLIAAVLLLAVLTPSAFAGARGLRSAAYFLSVVHVVNGLLHLGASIAAPRTVPGALTAPLLLVTGIWLANARTPALIRPSGGSPCCPATRAHR